MITKLNLSTNPFRNRRTPYLISLLMIGIAGLAGIFFLAKLRENRELNKTIVSNIEEMDSEVKRLKGEGHQLTYWQQNSDGRWMKKA